MGQWAWGGVEARPCRRWLPLSGNEVGSFFFFFGKITGARNSGDKETGHSLVD
jgi:hypothetical protein